MKSTAAAEEVWRTDPLTGPIAAEIPLPDAPLVRVIAQVRFPLIASVKRSEFIGPFQESIRKEYPILKKEEIESFAIAGERVALEEREVAWRFAAPSDWRLSLTPSFMALETTKYSSRADFVARLGRALDALQAHVDPGYVERIGVRYVDRLVGADIAEPKRLVRPEMLGVAGSGLASRLRHSLSVCLFALDGVEIAARWGFLQPNSTTDPGAIEPLTERSWIFDLDMYRLERRPFRAPDLTAEAESFAERLYTVFRWAVTDEFLRRFGGKP